MDKNFMINIAGMVYFGGKAIWLTMKGIALLVWQLFLISEDYILRRNSSDNDDQINNQQK